MIRKRFYLRTIAIFFIVNMSINILAPTVSLALTSGPSQPEFSSFEPVATTNMVNTFTGDFTYNLPVIEVPGPHGSGYPLSLSYHSGSMAEEEASWVGYGWTLSPGAINRNVRGFPDDADGIDVTYYNKMPKNWTATLGASASTELFGNDKIASLGLNASLRYNNYKGFGYNAGAGIYLGKGTVNLGFNVADGQGSFSLDVNPVALFKLHVDNQAERTEFVESYIQRELNSKDLRAISAGLGKVKSNPLNSSNYGLFTFGGGQRPSMVSKYDGKSFNLTTAIQLDPAPAPAGGTLNVFGSYSYQENLPETIAKARGYMYSANAMPDDVMDYYTEKESNFSKRDVFLGVPINNSDVFTATGEGVSGGFRMYHSSVGTFGPREVTSETDIFNVGAEVHVGPLDVGAGLDIGAGKQKMEIKDWNRNIAQPFSSPTDEAVDEPVFFRFNNDTGGDWGLSLNEDKQKASSRTGTVENLNLNLGQNGRSGRSSYIGFNTNVDMQSLSTAGYYKAYSKRPDLINDDLRSDEKAIGEFSVISEGGSRYTYALPVRSKMEGALSYGVRGIVNGDIDFNNHVIDGFNDEVKIGSTKDAPYTTAYLLTEINTPDYVDLTHNGPTTDDYGGYTRFNYEAEYDDDNWEY
ncbi:MAG: hypothetical protein AAFN93_05265 [Bacteroidota bacterium]